MFLSLWHFDKWRSIGENNCTETISTNKATKMKVTLCKRHWPENADKTASMETVQPDSGRADRTAAARKPHRWKRSLMET